MSNEVWVVYLLPLSLFLDVDCDGRFVGIQERFIVVVTGRCKEGDRDGKRNGREEPCQGLTRHVIMYCTFPRSGKEREKVKK